MKWGLPFFTPLYPGSHMPPLIVLNQQYMDHRLLSILNLIFFICYLFHKQFPKTTIGTHVHARAFYLMGAVTGDLPGKLLDQYLGFFSISICLISLSLLILPSHFLFLTRMHLYNYHPLWYYIKETFHSHKRVMTTLFYCTSLRNML